MLLSFLLFITFLESIISFVCLTLSFLKLKEPKLPRIIIGIIVLLFGTIFSIYAYNNFNAHVVELLIFPIEIIMMTTWFFICSGDKFFVSVFIFFTQFNIYIAVNCISDALTPHFHWSGIKYQFTYIIIRAFLYTTIILLLFKFVRPIFRKIVVGLDKEWRFMSTIPFVFIVLQIFLLYYPVMNWYRESYNWYIITVSYILFIVVYYVIAIQAYSIMEKYEIEKRELLVRYQNILWELELNSQKEALNDAARKQHDARHHIAVIINLIHNNDLNGLKEYMKEYSKTFEERVYITYCNNSIINSILNSYLKRAIKINITVNVQAAVPDDIKIDGVDLTCIFANVLENALEGCMRLSEETKGHILIIVKYIDKRLRIKVVNTCVGNINFCDGMPITQKYKGGTGTKSILHTAEKYSGMVDFLVKDGYFYTNIVLNTKDKFKI